VVRWIFILGLVSLLRGEDIAYSFHLSKPNPYLKEAIYLDVNLTQLDSSVVMFFQFSPKVSSDYEFQQLKFQEHEQHHARKHEYRYIIYPLKEGNVSIGFNMVKSVTTDDSVAYAISGDRDNIKSLEKRDIELKIPPLHLNVKPIPNRAELVGDFQIKYSLDRNQTRAYEPIYLHISLQGRGYLKGFDILPKSTEYHIFTQKPKVTPTSIEWDYAISSKGSFTIPKIELKGFNPTTERGYTLQTPAQHIEVRKLDSSTLLDREESPPPAQTLNWEWLGWLLSYLVVYMAGVLTPKSLFTLFRRKKPSDLEEQIARAKSHRELLKVLLPHGERYKGAIMELEGVIYHNRNVPLQRIKEMI